MDEKRFSIIIPNHNGSATIGKCIDAALSSNYGNFEVVVTDDCSTDSSVEIIMRSRCTLVRLDEHSGASAARNAGARSSTGDFLFFIDADCVINDNALALANEAVNGDGRAIIGGTYTMVPFDHGFFSAFQSAFIHYSETKKKEPDYIAAHAMIIRKDAFMKAGGFPSDFPLPIIEDVEFSHRLRKAGHRLLMNPEILVRHIFNFTLARSLKNAFRKSMYWTVYSLGNRDVTADSGTASRELKVNVASFFLCALTALLSLVFRNAAFLYLIPFIASMNIFANRRLLKAFAAAKGPLFAVAAAAYYFFVYPIPVGSGALGGVAHYLLSKRSIKA